MIKPLFTEKTLIEAQKGRFTFVVERKFSKYQVKEIVQNLFKVHVVSVATMNYKGLTRRTNRGTKVTTSSWKKAIVELKKGESIELFTQEKKVEKKAEKAPKAKKAAK
jgi:large subunit ribosomal protein L23